MKYLAAIALLLAMSGCKTEGYKEDSRTAQFYPNPIKPTR